VSLSDTVFGATYNETLVHQVVTAYMAGGRSGNAAQLTRSERSPIWTGGGVTFAAKKRDYSQKVNKKMYRGAIRSILSRAAENGSLIVADDIVPSEPKTRLLGEKLKSMDIDNALILVDEVQSSLYFASRNIPNIQVLDVDGIDPVSLMRYKHIIASPAALKMLDERLGD